MIPVSGPRGARAAARLRIEVDIAEAAGAGELAQHEVAEHALAEPSASMARSAETTSHDSQHGHRHSTVEID